MAILKEVISNIILSKKSSSSLSNNVSGSRRNSLNRNSKTSLLSQQTTENCTSKELSLSEKAA